MGCGLGLIGSMRGAIGRRQVGRILCTLDTEQGGSGRIGVRWMRAMRVCGGSRADRTGNMPRKKKSGQAGLRKPGRARGVDVRAEAASVGSVVPGPVHIGRLTASGDKWDDPTTDPHGEYGEGWRVREDGTHWSIGDAWCWRCTACETVMPPGGRWARCHICMTPRCAVCRQGVEEVQPKRATRRRSELVAAQERLTTASNRVCEACETASLASLTAEADMLDCSMQWTGGWPSIEGLGVWRTGAAVGVTSMCLPERVELRVARISETDVGVRPAREGMGHIGTAAVGWCNCGSRPAVWVTRLGGVWRGAAYVRCARAGRECCDLREWVRFWAAVAQPGEDTVVVAVVPCAPASLGQSVYGESVCKASAARGRSATPPRGGGHRRIDVGGHVPCCA